MKTTTSRERMRAVLRGTLPDRIPFFPTIYVDHACVACGRRFEDALANPALGQECMLEAARRYKTDAVRFCMGPDASWYDEKVVEERGKIPGRVDIDERPKEVAEKARLGDWEGDTVEGAKGTGYLTTMVDRKS